MFPLPCRSFYTTELTSSLIFPCSLRAHACEDGQGAGLSTLIRLAPIRLRALSRRGEGKRKKGEQGEREGDAILHCSVLAGMHGTPGDRLRAPSCAILLSIAYSTALFTARSPGAGVKLFPACRCLRPARVRSSAREGGGEGG